MSPRAYACVVLVGALAVGAFAHQVAGAEAAALGLSFIELAFIAAAVGAFVNRSLPAS